ncbi:carbohydrate kinase [Natronospirillum operosum]|uniref:Carbohydrate kinase n=1 Tax=Natronospirillum operosum TaxID=2759953 RepID=A0A4Z0W4M7_9GAMM|nr:FGGY-family carbohydrate kinase [Natronospirillum operosum]TGG92467.1 carbohydrate kinase [Natronospirillum operosum]
MAGSQDLLIGIDAGTSVVKAVAFTLKGEQVACCAIQNRYELGADGAATQSLRTTWSECVEALCALGVEVPGLKQRTAAIAVTGQGDGTWLVGRDNAPVSDAWIWLDARAAPTVDRIRASAGERRRFEKTGTGLNTCQQGAQLAHIAEHYPSLLSEAEVALHCKDWLYLCLTGVRATDPSEACFTFGDFRTREYDTDVLNALGLQDHRHLLPDINEGTEITHPLSEEAARSTGLLTGTPVVLGYVDMVMTGLGAGVYTGSTDSACSIIGSTGVHMRPVAAESVSLNDACTGYIMTLPVPGMVTQMQSNMAATLNVDWLLGLAAELICDGGTPVGTSDLLDRIDGWLHNSSRSRLIYHPYISEAGERGPFIDANARASFIGLNTSHGFADLLRAVVDGLGMATRDCYAAIGNMPKEIRLSGGAARSSAIQSVIASSVGAGVRVSDREEAGAAGAAMMAAVAVGVYADMDACIREWVSPLLGDIHQPNAEDTQPYARLYDVYRESREALAPVWSKLPTST